MPHGNFYYVAVNFKIIFMEITVIISGTYSDGQHFSVTVNSIERAIEELEMISVNDEFNIDE